MLISVAEGYDSGPPPEYRSSLPFAGLEFGGLSTHVAASANYSRDRRNVQLFGTAQTSLGYYPDVGQSTTSRYNGELGAAFRLPGRGTLRVNQTVTYAPFYLYQLFASSSAQAPEERPAATPEYRIDETESYSYVTSASASFGSPRVARLTASVDYSLTDSPNRVGDDPLLSTYGTSATLSRALSRNGSVSAGYTYHSGEFGTTELAPGPTQEHRLNVGGSYAVALSTSRRLTLRGNVSPTWMTVEDAAGQRQERVVQGDAGVDFPFRLRWNASFDYTRSVQYVAVLGEPVFTDSATIRVAGLVSRRLDVSASAGYVTGVPAIGPDLSSSNLKSYTGTAVVRFALSRAFAVYAEYLYYLSDLRAQAFLAPGLPELYEQHGIRVGVTMFARAFGR